MGGSLYQVIHQVLAHSLEVKNRGNIERIEFIGRPDSRSQQNRRTPIDASSQDDFLVCTILRNVSICVLRQHGCRFEPFAFLKLLNNHAIDILSRYYSHLIF